MTNGEPFPPLVEPPELFPLLKIVKEPKNIGASTKGEVHFFL